MRQTVVAVNAHPDDEAMLTGGTLAAFCAAGWRVVLVTLTRGEEGGTGSGGNQCAAESQGTRRMTELEASARALGAADVIDLGYADSGIGPEALPPLDERQRLHAVPVLEAATRLAAVLRAQRAGLVVGYDAAGGYGHRDHVCAHHIARAATALTPDVRLIEATAPREPILRAVRAGYRLRGVPGLTGLFTPGFTPQQWDGCFTPSAQITHRVDVRAHAQAKREALRAHASQHRRGERGPSPWDAVLGLPTPLASLLLGWEFFVEPARTSAHPSRRDALRDLMAGCA